MMNTNTSHTIRTSHLIAIFTVAAFSVSSFVGCSGGNGMVPVSGVVTVDDQPVAGLTVTFFPEPAEGNNAPGPFSTGVTDSNGKFTLTNRYGVTGAMAWRHRVSFEYDDVDPEAMDAARDSAADAKAAGEQISAETKAQRKQAKTQMAGKIRIPKRYNDGNAMQFVIDIPEGGTDTVKLEMKSK